MNVLIIGASGGTGRWVLEHALGEGHAITALVRDPARITLRHERLRVVAGDVTDPKAVEAALIGQDAVVSALGSPSLRASRTICAAGARMLVPAMTRLGVRRLVWMSAAGVGDSRPQIIRSSFVFGRIVLPLVLGRVYADHDVAEGIVRASGLDWAIVRPAQLTDGEPADILPVADRSIVLNRMSVSRTSVARFMVDELVAQRFVHRSPVLVAA